MLLHRVVDWDGATLGADPGGPLYVARRHQGAGRHDAPALYGAWYCSRLAVAAIAECLQPFRGQTIGDEDFARTGGLHKALVSIEMDDALRVVDLDDPSVLIGRRLRPSQVASPRRSITQPIAAALFAEGVAGLGWWSALNADWPHVTLFHERALPHVAVVDAPAPLSIDSPLVRDAAAALGVRC